MKIKNSLNWGFISECKIKNIKDIKDAQNANRQDLIEMWQVIKKDRQKHVHMLKEALEKEIHG